MKHLPLDSKRKKPSYSRYKELIVRWKYGKLAVFDISESGRAIGEKLILLLDERQQEELAQYLLERTTKTRTETMCFHLKHNWKQDSPLTEFQEGDLYLSGIQACDCSWAGNRPDYKRVRHPASAHYEPEPGIYLWGYHGFGLERRLHLLFPESHQ